MVGGNQSGAPGAALILLSGLPGAGKTTFARALAEAAPACAVDAVESDAIRRGLAKRPAYTPDENARVFTLAEERVRAALHAGHIAVLDATNLHTDDRRRFLRLARTFDIALVAVRLVAPDATIRERLSRPRDGFSEAGFEIVERMRPRVRPFTIPVIVVDTRFSLAPSIAAVLRLAGTAP